MRFVTQSTPYAEVELRQYAIQAIRLEQFKYKTVGDEVFPTLMDQVLKGFRENKISNSTKKMCCSLEAKIMKSPLTTLVFGEKLIARAGRYQIPTSVTLKIS